MGTLGIKMDRQTALRAVDAMRTLLLRVHTEYGIDNIVVAGSVRRGKETIGDIDIVLVTSTGEMDPNLSQYLQQNGLNLDAAGSKLIRGLTEEQIQFDFYSCTEDQYPFMIAYLTGPQDFNIGMRSQARKLGYKLNQFGLADLNGQYLDGIVSEAQLFHALGCEFIDPKDRTNWYQNLRDHKLKDGEKYVIRESALE